MKIIITLHKSSFILHLSSFIFHPSSFILHLSSFILHPSSFSLHPLQYIRSFIKLKIKCWNKWNCLRKFSFKIKLLQLEISFDSNIIGYLSHHHYIVHSYIWFSSPPYHISLFLFDISGSEHFIFFYNLLLLTPPSHLLQGVLYKVLFLILLRDR